MSQGTPASSRRRIRKDRLKSVRQWIGHEMKRPDELGESFICASALNSIWNNNRLLKDIISDSLTNDQLAYIRSKMLPFVSFLVWIDVEDWFDDFEPMIFAGRAEPIRNATLPLERGELQALKIEVESAKWAIQFYFIPATIRFHHTEEVQKIDGSVHLPFTKRDKNAIHGGYGKVELCEIAAEYVESRLDGDTYLPKARVVAVAVKTFEVREDAAAEVRNLKLLKSNLTKNESISLHLALIDHGAEYLIIFPRAEMGDLWQFLHCGSPPDDTDRQKHAYRFEDKFPIAAKMDTNIVPALLEQARDVASALEFLHRPMLIAGAKTFCAHMDLKPDNILIYRGGPEQIVGQWKICDFGISAFKEDEDEASAPSGSVRDLYNLATMKIRPKRSEGSYQPPEVARMARSGNTTPKDRRRVGRRGDVWSFGAIFGEILSFAMNRTAYVQQFRQCRLDDCTEPRDDYFYSEVEVARDFLSPTQLRPTTTYILRPAVENWLRKMAEEASAPRQSIDCWAEVVIRILQVDVERRPDARELVKMVQHVYHHSCKARHPREIACEYVDDRVPANRDIAAVESSLAPAQDRVPGGSNHQGSIPRLSIRSPTLPNLNLRLTQGGLSDSGLSQSELENAQINIRTLDTPAFPPSGTHPLPDNILNNPPLSEEDLPRLVAESNKGLTSERSSVASSFLVGKPSNAHGIVYNYDKKRDQWPPKRLKFQPKPRSVKSLCVDITSAKKIRAAYLTNDFIYVYSIELTGSEHAATSMLCAVPLTDSKAEWLGVALASNYLVVWGKKPDGGGIFRFANIENPTSVSLNQVPSYEALEQFDYHKRVAVSSLGFAALICRSKVLIIDLQAEPPVVFAREAPTNLQRFTDVAFNDTGELLYAWVTRSATELLGALFVYRVTRIANTRPESQGYYRCDANEKIPTGLLPYNDYHGCIVAANGRIFYPAVIKPSSLKDCRNLPRYHSEAMLNAEVKASCMFNNHSIITVQKIRLTSGPLEWHDRLVEYPLKFGENHQIGDPREICKLGIRSSTTSVVKVVQLGANIFIIVVHKSGEIEMVRFKEHK